ncbi:MGH1-like glycoside hydrolase domain-containing protein [Oceaniglobus indicus]|uniref:MGH1-like glycoside hydrolase domain-containing protein n=1 Tax=Oceaniglobus indicus TaxID=2047749 RepID=UPI0013045DA0|nr:trehalase family glycosidase [Oceaniglobus indicus]
MIPLPDHPGSPADRSGGIAAHRAFGTWSPDHPAAMVFLPLGLSVTPVAFAASTGKSTAFPAGPDLRLGSRSVEAARIEAGMTHAGTVLDWQWDKPDPFTAQGRWTTRAHGEWGLRFWVCLALGAPAGCQWRWDTTAGAAMIRIGHRWGVVAPDPAPLMVTGHADLDGLTDELEARGYFFLESRKHAAPLLALRFNLEEAASARFGFAVGDDLDETLARARQPDRPATLPGQTGAGAGALDAVRDVIGWNTLFDPVNRRPYTGLSRNWTTAKFGGFGVWLNDVLFNALLASTLEPEVARDNLLAVIAGATPQGNLPCLLTGNDAWIDRSQPPIAAFVLAMHVARWPDPALVARVLPVLLRGWDWWWRMRDPDGTGMVRYGTSDIGNGLYRGTKLGAKDESAMDNSPVHDQATLDPATGLLDSYDVGLNALLALEGEMLGDLLAAQGRMEQASAVRAKADALKDAIRTRLWDPARRVFANRLLDGRFVDSLAPTSFYPMIAGIPTPEQIDGLMVHLHDPAGFGGPARLPSVRRDDPAFGDQVYWRGRVWPPMNWFTWAGLRRMDRATEAAALASESHALFYGPWEANRHAAENFAPGPEYPAIQPDTDTFYSWSALMPAMAVAEVADVTPWEGFSLSNGNDVTLGPVATPCGMCTVDVAGGVLRLLREGSTLLETDIRGRFTHVRIDRDRLHLTLPRDAAAGYIRVDRRKTAMAQQGDGPLKTATDGAILILHTADVTDDATRRIDVVFA